MAKRYPSLLFLMFAIASVARALPQYRIDLQSILIPGNIRLQGMNSVGTSAKFLAPNNLMLRNPDGSYVISDAAPNGYDVDGSHKPISQGNRVFLSLSYISDGGVKTKPVYWSESEGFQFLPDLITIPPNPSYSYEMYTANASGTVAGGGFWFLAGNNYNFTPTRFKKSGNLWTTQFFNGQGKVTYVDSDGTSYGQFNYKAGIWRMDGSFAALPAPFQGDPHNPTMLGGRSSNGKIFGQSINEIWVWDNEFSQPMRYATPQNLLWEFSFLHVNAKDEVAYSGAAAQNSKAYYFTEQTGSVTFNSLLAPEFADYNVNAVQEIDDSGRVLGFAYPPGSSVFQPVILTPVPEPSTLALVGAGVTVLVFRRKKRN